MSKIFLALLTVFLVHPSVHAADKIRITVSGLSGQFMTFPLAQKRGFLKEEGIDAEIIRITGAASRAALGSGEVDYGTGLGSNIGGAITGLPIKVVACYVPAPVLALVARPELKSVQGLRGKTSLADRVEWDNHSSSAVLLISRHGSWPNTLVSTPTRI
jgi:ABC-type nitrate/sulfonate/bicarbonate transport system substrate-binding protein